MYCNNTALMYIIKQSIPKLKDEELEIRWAFVSKSKEPSTNKNYYRFTPAEDNVRRGISNKVTPLSFLFAPRFLIIIEIVLYYIYDF